MTEIQTILYNHRDPKYAEFIAKSIPTLPKEAFIGVRSPEYKKIMKEMPDPETVDCFLETLPHEYYEENIVHSILICGIREYETCLRKVAQFLPYVDNWAVCDGMNPAAFAEHLPEIREKAIEWMASDAPYTQRFGMRMVMIHFLDEHFDPELLERAAALRSEEYYVNMMIAWLFAEALAKQWDTAIRYIEEKRLDKWTHNKAIQKAKESFRITDEQKAYLKDLRMK